MRIVASGLPVAVLVPLLACNEGSVTSIPTAPTAPEQIDVPVSGQPAVDRPIVLPSGPGTAVVGTVFLHTTSGPKRAANVPLEFDWLRVDGAHIHPVVGQVVTDVDGRYRVEGLNSKHQGHIVFRPPDLQYVIPCDARIGLERDGVLDVHIVSTETLLTTGLPASLPRIGFSMSGTVTERTADGLRPVSNAVVTTAYAWATWWDEYTPFTTTDVNGRYVLCGFYERLSSISAWKPGYSTDSEIFDASPHPDVIDFELTREE